MITAAVVVAVATVKIAVAKIDKEKKGLILSEFEYNRQSK